MVVPITRSPFSCGKCFCHPATDMLLSRARGVLPSAAIGVRFVSS